MAIKNSAVFFLFFLGGGEYSMTVTEEHYLES